MTEYVVKFGVAASPDINPQELQGCLNLPDMKKRLQDLLGAALLLPCVPERKKYPPAGTFAVGLVVVEKK
jgi:hypothetical protein